MKITDKQFIKPYLELCYQLIESEIPVSIFVSIFTDKRRADDYWMNGYFDPLIEQILNTLFFDIDEYTPPDLQNDNSKWEIDEIELRKRVIDSIKKIESLL